MSVGADLQSLALALLLASSHAFPAERVRIVDSQTIVGTDTRLNANASHDLVLYVHTFQGTRWHASVIIQAVVDGTRLLAQCGVALQRLELHTLEAPRAFHFYSTRVSRELLRSLDVSKPALFFVEDTRNDPGFDAEAVGLANAKTRPELANTIWVACGARDLPYALAHELVHVLSDSAEHSNEPGNLMRDETARANSSLSAAQCDRVRSHGAANGLLAPR